MSIELIGGLLLGLAFVVWLVHLLRRKPLRINLGKWAVGSVYIFRDKGHVGIVKIGMTGGRATVKRKIEVSRQMAGGSELAQIYAVDHLPFPRTVESVAHRIMIRRRVRWPDGSPRGREWFHAKGSAGEERAIKAVERAAALVRITAKKKGRWPVWADAKIAVWRLAGSTVKRYRLFMR